VFELLHRDSLINIEMRALINVMGLMAQQVAESISRHRRWASTLIASYDPVALYYLRQLEPRISRGYIWSKSHPFLFRPRWIRPLVQADWYDPANETYNGKQHVRFRQHGQRVFARDPDFRLGMDAMAAVRLGAVVNDRLA